MSFGERGYRDFIKREIEQKDMAEYVKVIRESFKTVADELGFTAQNAPRFTAFSTSEERLNEQLKDECRLIYAYNDEDVVKKLQM